MTIKIIKIIKMTTILLAGTLDDRKIKLFYEGKKDVVSSRRLACGSM